MDSRMISAAIRSTALLVALVASGAALAQAPDPATIVFDGTLGAPGDAPFTEVGSARNYEIPEDRGSYDATATNLFHSFELFDIERNDSATFTASLGSPDRVIARVTGGRRSRIDGLLASSVMNADGQGADLFLINSSGITIGGGASLQVPGSLYFSTSHVLRFEGGPDFPTHNVNTAAMLPAGLLSSAPPAAFGFTDDQHLNLVDVAPRFLTDGLRVSPGKTLSFVGADPGTGESGITMLSFEDSPFFDKTVEIDAPDANVQMASAAGVVDIPVHIQSLDPEAAPPGSLGRVSIGSSFTIDAGDPTTSPSTGSIVIRGGEFLLEQNAELLASVVDVAVSGEAEVKSEAQILGESVFISGKAIAVRDFEDPVRPKGGGRIFGGTVLLGGESVEIDGTNSVVGISTSIGTEGVLDIRADTLSVTNGGQVESLAENADSGGDVVIGASESVVVSGASGSDCPGESCRPSTIFAGSEDPSAISGTISVETPVLEVSNGGVISVANAGLVGTGGENEAPKGIEILASERVTVEGGENGASVIRSQSTGSGRGGGLSISPIEEGDGLLVQLLNGGQVSASTSGSGDAGSVEIVADVVEIEGLDPALNQSDSGIFAASNVELAQSGDGGDITVMARRLSVLDFGVISVSTNGGGDAGTITLNVGESLLLSGPIREGIRKGKVEAGHGVIGATGAPGEIVITAGQSVSLVDGAQITAQSDGPAPAGNVTIDAGRRFEAIGFGSDGTTRSGVTTRVTTASELSSGGQVTIAATELVYLLDGEISANVVDGAGSGGDVAIGRAKFVVLNGGRVLASAAEDQGGNIDIATGTFFASAPFVVDPPGEVPDRGSVLDATSKSGSQLNGTINVEAPETELVIDLAALPASFLDAAALLGSACEARTSRAGSFHVVRRHAAALSPPDALLAPVGLSQTTPGTAVFPVSAQGCPPPEETP